MNSQNNSGAAPGSRFSFTWSALMDVLIIVAVLVTVKQFFLLYTLKYAGPISTASAMVIATWRLRSRGMSWSDLGFKKPESWPKTLLWAGPAFGVIVVFGAVGGEVAQLFFERGYVADRFGGLEGDVPQYLLWMLLVWTHSAFFEEMLFRAFIINRLGAFMGGSTAATLLSVVIAAVFFGYRHAYYQGAYGFVVTGVIGLGLGLFYVWVGRKNLLPQILAHGATNSIGFTMRLLGLKP